MPRVTIQSAALIYADLMKSFIGIDVRQRQHYAVAITERGQMSFLFTHRPVGFENFSRWIAEVAPLPRVFAVNQNEPFSSAVAAWLRYNGEAVHVVESQADAQGLAESLRDGGQLERKPGKVAARELLDLAMLYLRISVAALG